jgi:hypothetical protein
VDWRYLDEVRIKTLFIFEAEVIESIKNRGTIPENGFQNLL